MNTQTSKLLCLFAFFVLLFSGCASPQFIENQITEDIYGLMYYPSTPQTRDVVIMLCGGSGFHEQYTHIAESLTQQDYHVVIIDYYGGGKDWGGRGIDSCETLERYHQNVQRGIAWVKDDSGIDPEQLFILGFSYGATIGLNVAAERDDISAVANFYGDMNMGIHNDLLPGTFISQLPPVLLIYGDQDRVVSTDEGKEMMHMLEQYGIPHQELVIPGMVHGFVTDKGQDDVVNTCLKTTDVWFRKYGH
jgi:dienelactone hydrolase